MLFGAMVVGILSWTIGCSKGAPEPTEVAKTGAPAQTKADEQAKSPAATPIPPKPQTTFFPPHALNAPPALPAPQPQVSGPAPVAAPIAAAPTGSTEPAPAPSRRPSGGQDFSRPLVPLESPSAALPPATDLSPAGRPAATPPTNPALDELPPMLLGGDRVVVPLGNDSGKSKSDTNPLRKPGAESKPILGKTPGTVLEPLGAGSVYAPKPSTATPPASPVAHVDTLDKNNPVLVIDAAWKSLTRPSLQMVLVTDAQADLSKLAPVPVNASDAIALWEQQVGAINKPLFPSSREVLKTSTAFLEYRSGRWIRVRARVNSLGRAAAYAVEDKNGTGVAIYLLDAWADNRGALRIALSDLDVAPKFTQPGRLKAWLLSDEKTVGTVTTDWPGKPEAASKATDSGKPATDSKLPVPQPGPAAVGSTPKAAPPAAQSKPSAPPATAAATAPQTAAPVPPKTAEAQPAPTAKPAAPVTAPTPPASTAATKPPASPAPAASTGPKDIHTMSIDELATHIEQTYADQMNRSVRKAWLGGMRNYYTNENTEAFRRDLFMTFLKSCWKEQRQGDLRNAFAVLYQKLKSQQTGGQASK
jgi:hypothetical protein